jgi:hypothetical protein
MIVALSTIHLWLFLTSIAVVWVVFGRSLLVVSNQSALMQTMQTIIQPQTQRPNLQLGGSVSMDTEDVPHTHPGYPIDITGWTYPKRRFSMAEYCSRRTANQYALPSNTNIQFFHSQLQFDIFWGTLMDTNFHKHQVIDWTFMLGQSVMEDLIPKFEACGLYHFMGQITDFSEMAVKQFLAIAEIDIDEESITWMTGFKRYSATFAEFATTNSLDYNTISAEINLYTEDNFEEFVQFYEPARLGIPRRFGETAGLRHHPAVINKIARVIILPKSGDKSKIRDKLWNIIHHVMNGEVMNVVLFMMRQLNDLKMDKNQNLAYAPYIMALIKAKTRFEGHYEIVHTPFRPFKNEIGFLTRPLTPFPDDEEEAGYDAGEAPKADAEQMPPPPPPLSLSSTGSLVQAILTLTFRTCSKGFRPTWMVASRE